MSNINSKIVITQENNIIKTFLINDNNVERLFLSSNSKFPIGTVVIARVQKVKKDLKAAFVELDKSTPAFLSFDDIDYKLIVNRTADNDIKENDAIIVMVSKEAVKTKPITVTCKLSIQGSYSVIHNDGSGITISSKIPADEKKKLFIDYYSCFSNSKYGIILRTNCKNADIEIVKQEISASLYELDRILSIGRSRTVYSILYSSVPPYIEQIRTINLLSYSSIFTDDQNIYESLINYNDCKNIILYNDNKVSLKALYSLDKYYQQATARKINLKSGGFIIIDPCEAMTVIDVNSGKVQGKDKDNIIDTVNIEAAEEIARQLILRNISGIIIIDFINYKDKQAFNRLSDIFKALIKEDPVKTSLIDITPLGLMEITRQKKYSSIYDYINNLVDKPQ